MAASSEQAALGRYLAQTSCAQCHGTDLRGAEFPDFTSPTLQSVAAYSLQQFTTLMRTGAPLGGQRLLTMEPWARQTLSHLIEAEITALDSYLHTLPGPTALLH